MKMLRLFAGLAIASPAVAGVSVVAPRNNSNVATSVQYVAITTTACAIYTASNVLAYTLRGSKLNTVLSLKPSTYITVVQEWDNCSGLFRRRERLTLTFYSSRSR
jgi:hypothetical protein